MSEFQKAIADADMAVFECFGEACTYTDAPGSEREALVVVTENVEIASAYDTQIPVLRTVADFRSGAIPAPKRGHEFTLLGASKTHTVDRLDSDDGHKLRVLLQ